MKFVWPDLQKYGKVGGKNGGNLKNQLSVGRENPVRGESWSHETWKKKIVVSFLPCHGLTIYLCTPPQNEFLPFRETYKKKLQQKE